MTMSANSRTVKPIERRAVNVGIGNASECQRAISAAIAKRAYEIYQLRGRIPGCDLENWRLAESEVLRPLGSYGMLDSKEETVISMRCNALGGKEIDKLEVCVEPRRLILAGKKGNGAAARDLTTVYRVLRLKEEFDPSSVKLTMKQHGTLLEIQLRKLGQPALVHKRAA